MKRMKKKKKKKISKIHLPLPLGEKFVDQENCLIPKRGRFT